MIKQLKAEQEGPVGKQDTWTVVMTVHTDFIEDIPPILRRIHVGLFFKSCWIVFLVNQQSYFFFDEHALNTCGDFSTAAWNKLDNFFFQYRFFIMILQQQTPHIELVVDQNFYELNLILS